MAGGRGGIKEEKKKGEGKKEGEKDRGGGKKIGIETPLEVVVARVK